MNRQVNVFVLICCFKPNIYTSITTHKLNIFLIQSHFQPLFNHPISTPINPLHRCCRRRCNRTRHRNRRKHRYTPRISTSSYKSRSAFKTHGTHPSASAADHQESPGIPLLERGRRWETGDGVHQLVICVLVVDECELRIWEWDVRKLPVGAAVFVLVCMKKWEDFGGRTYENRQGSRGSHLLVRLCVNISISSAQSICCTAIEVVDTEDVRKPPGKPGKPPVGAAAYHQQPYPHHRHGIQRNVRNPPGNPGNGADGRGPAGRLAIHVSDAFDVYDRWRRTQSRDRGDRRAGRLALDEGGGEGAVVVVSM
jgi:hypothetical protein